MTATRPAALASTLLLLAAAGPATAPVVRSGPPAVGDAAPDVSLDTPAGQPVRLSDLRKGGPVVVIQLRGWVGYQCPLCQKQVAAFVARADGLGFEVGQNRRDGLSVDVRRRRRRHGSLRPGQPHPC